MRSDELLDLFQHTVVNGSAPIGMPGWEYNAMRWSPVDQSDAKNQFEGSSQVRQAPLQQTESYP
jgi:hypothetical protein